MKINYEDEVKLVKPLGKDKYLFVKEGVHFSLSVEQLKQLIRLTLERGILTPAELTDE